MRVIRQDVSHKSMSRVLVPIRGGRAACRRAAVEPARPLRREIASSTSRSAPAVFSEMSDEEQRDVPFTLALIAGGCAGTAVDVALYPLDTLRTRLQSPDGFWKAGGFSRIYTGVVATALGAAPGAAFFFSAYEGMKPVLKRMNGGQEHPIQHSCAASCGEVAACLARADGRRDAADAGGAVRVVQRGGGEDRRRERRDDLLHRLLDDGRARDPVLLHPVPDVRGAEEVLAYGAGQRHDGGAGRGVRLARRRDLVRSHHAARRGEDADDDRRQNRGRSALLGARRYAARTL